MCMIKIQGFVPKFPRSGKDFWFQGTVFEVNRFSANSFRPVFLWTSEMTKMLQGLSGSFSLVPSEVLYFVRPRLRSLYEIICPLISEK